MDESGIPKITYYNFSTGAKPVTECTREELIEIVEFCAIEIERLRKLIKEYRQRGI